MYLPQRLSNNAPLRVAALTMFGEAGGQNDRSINLANHFKRVNRLGRPRQPISAIRTLLASQQSGPNQLLQDLGEKRQRNPIALRNLFRASRTVPFALSSPHRQVLDGNQAVVGFLGQLEHDLRLNRSGFIIAIPLRPVNRIGSHSAHPRPPGASDAVFLLAADLLFNDLLPHFQNDGANLRRQFMIESAVGKIRRV